MIDAHRVVFNGLDSLDFDITPHLSFDGDNGGTASFLNREAVHSEHYDGSFRRIHSYKYNEVLSPTFTFLKQNFSDFDESENRRILSWLTASDKPGWIDIYKDDSNVVSYRLFGNFTETEVYKLGNGRVVGYVATFESSAPYAYSRLMTYPFNLDLSPEIAEYLTVFNKYTMDITCDTDEYNKVLYPTVTVVFKGQNAVFPISFDPLKDLTYTMVPNVVYYWEEQDSYYTNLNQTKYFGRHKIGKTSSDAQAGPELKAIADYWYMEDTNVINAIATTTDDKNNVIYTWEAVAPVSMAVRIINEYTLAGEDKKTETLIAGGSLNEVIVFDGTNKVISATSDGKPRIIGDNFNLNWVPLAYGNNKITIEGQCDIKFEWIEPRKVGSL